MGEQEKLERASGTEGSRFPALQRHSRPLIGPGCCWGGFNLRARRGAEERLYLRTQERFQGLVSY